LAASIRPIFFPPFHVFFFFERSTVYYTSFSSNFQSPLSLSGLMIRILHVQAHRSITAGFVLCQPPPKHVQCQTHTHLRG
jgi:hypothetical protein